MNYTGKKQAGGMSRKFEPQDVAGIDKTVDQDYLGSDVSLQGILYTSRCMYDVA
jgi:hypothetical protein